MNSILTHRILNSNELNEIEFNFKDSRLPAHQSSPRLPAIHDYQITKNSSLPAKFITISEGGVNFKFKLELGESETLLIA